MIGVFPDETSLKEIKIKDLIIYFVVKVIQTLAHNKALKDNSDS